jgi:hypothetical protein
VPGNSTTVTPPARSAGSGFPSIRRATESLKEGDRELGVGGEEDGDLVGVEAGAGVGEGAGPRVLQGGVARRLPLDLFDQLCQVGLGLGAVAV